MKAKEYSLMQNVGCCRYVVNYVTGDQFHQDGSLFADIYISNNKRDANKFIRSLQKQGYTSQYSSLF